MSESGTIFAGSGYDGVWRSTDGGQSWNQSPDGPVFGDTEAIIVSPDGTVFAAINGGAMYRSTDDGVTWTIGQNLGVVWSLAVSRDGVLYAGTLHDGVYASIDTGRTWAKRTAGLTNLDVISIAVGDDGHVFASTFGGTIFRSTDHGASWVSTGLTAGYCLLARPLGNIWAGSDNLGVMISFDDGGHWTDYFSGFHSLGTKSLAIASSGRVFAGQSAEGVYRSTYQYPILCAPKLSSPVDLSTGQPTTLTMKWVLKGTAAPFYPTTSRVQISSEREFSSAVLIDTSIVGDSLSIGNLPSGKRLYWRTRSKNVEETSNWSAVWSFSTGLASIAEGAKPALPSTFGLEQNHPNPFNPRTTITYSLPKTASVSLRIFNALGQVITTLVNERKEAGCYQVTWNANVPSGIYFYRLQAGDASTGSARGFVETKKMIVLRVRNGTAACLNAGCNRQSTYLQRKESTL